MAARANELMNRKQVAYVLGRNAPGIFEIALWMRGFENYYCDLVANQPFAEALLDAIMEVKMKYWARALELVGPNVMIISEADDLASQNRCLVSPDLYRQLIKPRHTKLFTLHQEACAGAGEDLLPLLRGHFEPAARPDRVGH